MSKKYNLAEKVSIVALTWTYIATPLVLLLFAFEAIPALSPAVQQLLWIAGSAVFGCFFTLFFVRRGS